MCTTAAVHGDKQAGECWKKHWLFEGLTTARAKGRIWAKKFPIEEDMVVLES